MKQFLFLFSRIFLWGEFKCLSYSLFYIIILPLLVGGSPENINVPGSAISFFPNTYHLPLSLLTATIILIYGACASLFGGVGTSWTCVTRLPFSCVLFSFLFTKCTQFSFVHYQRWTRITLKSLQKKHYAFLNGVNGTPVTKIDDFGLTLVLQVLQ